MSKKTQIIEEVSKTSAGAAMLRKAKSLNTKVAYSRAVLLFSEYLKKPIDQIVEEYRADVKANMYDAFDKWEGIFEDFGLFLQERCSGFTPILYHTGALALINANVPRSLRLKAKAPEAYSKTIPPISIEDLRHIDKACDERERTFIRILKDSGISQSDALTLNYGQIRSGLERNETFIKIDMLRGKEHVEYETFLGPNAVEMLKIYLDIRRIRGEQITDETPIFANLSGKRLTTDAIKQIFWQIEQRTGKTISTHRLRKFFETYMAIGVRHPIVLKYWMGHKIRARSRDIEARYVIPPTPEQLALYKESYKNIDLTPKPEAEELLKAEIKARMEAMNVEERRRFATEIATIYREHAGRLLEDEDIKELLEEETQTDGAQINCNGRFEQINESMLLEYLRNGWRVIHNLQNGEVIVGNNLAIAFSKRTVNP